MTDGRYETDFAEWALAQATLLQKGDFATLDLGNLVDAVRTLGKQERRKTEKNLLRILSSLLILPNAPDKKHRRKLRRKIQHRRKTLRSLLKDNATIRSELDNYVSEAYPKAVDVASIGTEREYSMVCPWMVAQILDVNFWPEGEHP